MPPSAVATGHRSAARRRGKAERDVGRVAIVVARVGLATRSAFYLILVYLVIQLAVDGGGGKQANAHGALSTIASNPPGRGAIAATAVGLLAFGSIRLWDAIRSRRAPWRNRIALTLQGLFYVAVTWVPLSYALGHRSAGSEQQQHQTVRSLLQLPGGRAIVFGSGLVLIGVCVRQMWRGLDQDFTKGMKTRGSPRWIRRLIHLTGTAGIPARAMVFAPIGIFLMIAAVQSNPRRADGLDAELATLARNTWGIAVLGLVALGLALFSAYALLEARYRDVTKPQ